jgi:Predicted membrane protein
MPAFAYRPRAMNASSESLSERSVPAGMWPGLLLSVGLALVAWWLGRRLPLVGGPVFGIVIGILVRNLVAPGPVFAPGIRFGGKQVLQWSIVALGFGLSLTQVAKTGLQSLSVTLVTMTVAFATALVLGRMLKVHDKLKILIGVGTAICGGSAIAAVTPIIAGRPRHRVRDLHHLPVQPGRGAAVSAARPPAAPVRPRLRPVGRHRDQRHLVGGGRRLQLQPAPPATTPPSSS